MGRETAYVRRTLHMRFFVLKRSWFASLDSSHALPLLSNYSQVSERSYGCHLCGVRNLELSERLVGSPFFLSIASPRRVPRGTVSDGSGSEFWMFVCRMAQQAHGKMFEVDLPLYLCDWGTMACRLPVPASHWAAVSDHEKHPLRSFYGAFSCTLGKQTLLEKLKANFQGLSCFAISNLTWVDTLWAMKSLDGFRFGKQGLGKGLEMDATGSPRNFWTGLTEHHVTQWESKKHQPILL